MKKATRLISVILVLVIMIGIMPINVIAAEIKDNTGYMELSDGYLSVKVSKKNGGFLVDTLEGNTLKKSDDNKYLLYPDEDYDTSYTSFRVKRGDKVNDYIFGRDYGFLGLASSDVELTEVDNGIKAVWSVDDITFTQTLTLLDESANQHGMVFITYEAENHGEEAQIEARILLDTALGYQDYAIYELTQPSGEYLTIENEQLLDGNSYSSSFFAYDDEFTPSVTAYNVNATVNNKIAQPTKVAFGHWNNLASTVFDFTPDSSMYFTNPQNEYLTSDSAYALYFDMGNAATNGTATAIGTYYGVYSNANTDVDSKIAINFEMPQGLALNDDLSGYVSLQGNGAPGTFAMNVKITNISDEVIESMAIAIYPENGLTPYDTNGDLYTAGTYDNPYYLQIVDMLPGEERQAIVNFAAIPNTKTEYRKIGVKVFDYKDTTHLLEEKLIGERDAYILCPAGTGDTLGFTGITPDTVFTSGTRNLYITGTNFAFIRDKESYDVILRAADGRPDIKIASEKIFIDTEENTAEIVLDMELSKGTWQVLFDWKDPTKLDVTSDALRFSVSDNASYKNSSYGVLVIDLNPDYNEDADNTNKYRITVYEDEEKYSTEKDWLYSDYMDATLMEFRGSFTVTYGADNKTIVGAKATSVEGGDTINISNCLDIDNGTLEITVENAGSAAQEILVDINGKIYTSVERTKVWDGVCALSAITNNTILAKYNQIGKHLNDNVETSEANQDNIMLCWPGAASGAQTLAGMVMEFRYAEFGRMFTESDKNEGASKFVIAFGAEVSPDFLVPNTYVYDKADQAYSDYQQDQLRLAGKPYLAKEVRDQNTRWREEIRAITNSKGGSFAIALHDILFGGGFIGFNASVDIGIPSYAEGMPALQGTLNMKVMGSEWAMNVKGRADLLMFEVEGELGLRSYNGIPVPDKLYFFMGGITPGVNVDGMGIFWIRGLGGGIDKIYDTIFTASQIPPLTIMVKAQVALFAVLTATGELSVSARGFSASVTDLGFNGVPILNELSGELYWYPKIRFGAYVNADILDVIYGEGSFLLQEMEDGSTFWEGFVTAGIKVPDWVPFIPNMNIGSADLGFNEERIWGAIHILSVDAGITYYWGGDVEFGFGKYDSPEPTVRSFKMRRMFSVPVYEDAETGDTLYMSLMASDTGLSESMVDKSYGTHYITFPENYSSNEDALISTVFRAESLEDAKAKVSIETYDYNNFIYENYPLIFVDETKTLDDPANANANAMLVFDENTKKATLTFTVTDSQYFSNHNFLIYGDTLEDTQVYGMPRFADIESIELDSSATTLTVNGDVDSLDKITVYANNGTSAYYVLYEGTSSESIALTYPELMPSGTYTITAVGATDDKTSNPIAEIKNVNYTNPNEPNKPSSVTATLGGDYSIDISVADSDDNYDGYLATVYEVDAEGNLVPTIFKDILMEKANVLTVGGRYTTSIDDYSYEDINLVEEEIVYGLEAGKTYRVGIRTYKTLSDTSQLPSSEVLSDAIVMTEAIKPTVSMTVSDKVTFEGIDYTSKTNVTINITSDTTLKNTKYSLDGTEDKEWTEFTGNSIALTGLADGGHRITVRGEDAEGDGFEESYLFTVRSTSPVLMLSSPDAGSFYGDKVIVSGITDANATVTVLLDNNPQTATADGEGNFRIELDMNKKVAYQDITIVAENFLGVKSREIFLTLANELLGSKNIHPVILCDGIEVTKLDQTYNGKTLEFALKCGTDGEIIRINSNSVIANRVSWEIVNVSGNASITDGGVVSDISAISNGMVCASVDSFNTGAQFGSLSSDKFQNITFGVTNVSKTVDEEFTLPLTGAETDAIVIYSSSDSSIATVDQNGKVTAHKSGTAIISAISSAVGDFAQTSAGYTLTVVKKEIPVPSIANKSYTGATLTADIVDTQYYTVTKNEGGINAGAYEVILKITDTDKYTWVDSNDESKELEFIISVAAPSEVVFPTASKITYGQKLSDSLLSGGVGDGRFVWTNGDQIPTVQNSGYEVTFVPNNTTDYDYSGITLTKVIEVEVEKQQVAVPTFANKVYSGSTLTADIADTEYYTVVKNDGGISVGKYEVILKLKDAENYTWVDSNDESKELEFIISVAAPSEVVFPTASKITYGQKLSDSLLSGGVGDGRFVWTNGDQIPTVQNSGYEVTFIPNNTTDYDYSGITLTKVIEVIVEPKSITRPRQSQDVYYNGEEQSYAVISTDEYTVVCDKQINANEDGYTVTISLVDKNNTVWDDNTTADINHKFVIKKALPSINSLPIVTKLFVGDELNKSTFSGGEIFGVGASAISGTYSWLEPNKLMNLKGIYEEKVIFTPDNENYSSVELTILVEVIEHSVQTHTHSYNSNWEFDENNHWKECECSDKTEVEEHNDADNDGKCDVCDYTVEIAPINPEPSPPEEESKNNATVIVIIVVASIVLLGGGFATWFVIKKKKLKKQDQNKDKKTKDKKTEDRKTEDRKTEDRKSEDKKTKDKKTKDKKTEDKKSEDKKSSTPNLQ